MSPASLSPSCVQGQNAADQSFTVQNTGGGTLSYSIAKNAAWLSVTPASGTSTGEPDTIAVNYATSGLAPGTYTGTITVTASGATGSPKTIGVTLTVTALPVLAVNPASLSPSCVQGQNAADQSFTVQNTGGGTLSYTISKNAAWLSVTPASGTSTGEQDTIAVNYATSRPGSGDFHRHHHGYGFRGHRQPEDYSDNLNGKPYSSHHRGLGRGQRQHLAQRQCDGERRRRQTFTITANTGYHVADVLVDGVSVGAVTSYPFTNVTSDHTIVASFAVDIPVVHTITATAGPHGSISPTGSVPVNHGGSQSFTIRPDANYNIKTVLVDGVSVGPVSSYTFTNVTADHTITANFVATTISILTDKDQVRVPPGKTAPLQVKLSDEPSANVVVTVAWLSGSPALSIQGVATLTFTPANWNTYQTVQITATPDQNDMNATAVFQFSAPGLDGETDHRGEG